jgi:hypothetical protein
MTMITLNELELNSSPKENETMNKNASLTNLWQASFDNQGSPANYIPTMEKMAAGYVPQTREPEMQKSAAEHFLDGMCKSAAIDYHVEMESQKQAGDYYGKLYGQSVWAGFVKAAEMDGVNISTDSEAVNAIPTGSVQQNVAVAPTGPGQDGWMYLNQNLPTKPVGQVGSASTFNMPVGLYGVPSAT